MGKKAKVRNFTEGPILGPLLKFTLPVFGALILQALYGAVDLLIVGQFATTMSVSGVAMGTQLTHSVTIVTGGFAMGTTILLGQLIGKKKTEEAGKVVGSSIWLFAALAVIISAVLFFFAGPVLGLLQTPPEAMPEGISYTKICGIGFIFIAAYNLLGSVFRGIGDSTTPLITVAIACVVNIVGDLLLVAVFHMAAAGAAIATVFAQGISVIISLWLVKKKGLPFAFNKESLKLKMGLVGQIVKLGIPLALQEIVVSSSFLVTSAVTNSLGLIASAGVGVSSKLTGFIMLFPSAYMQSMSAFSAQNIGAKKLDRATKAMLHGIWTSLAFSMIMGYFSILHGEWLTQIFSKDPEVIVAAAQYLKAFGIDTFLTSIYFCFIGFLNGCGKTTVTMIEGFIGVAVRVPTCFLFRAIGNGSLFLIGLSTPTSTFVQNIIVIIYFILVKKKLNALYGEELVPEESLDQENFIEQA